MNFSAIFILLIKFITIVCKYLFINELYFIKYMQMLL